MRAMNERQITADHPDYRMLDVAPPTTLTHARAIVFGNGLHPVYTDNVHGLEGVTTFCPGCHAALVRRDCDVVLSCRIDAGGDARGTCPRQIPVREAV